MKRQSYKNPKSLIYRFDINKGSEKELISASSKINAWSRIADLIRELNMRKRTIYFFIVALLSSILINFLTTLLSMTYSNSIIKIFPYLIFSIILSLIGVVLFCISLLKAEKEDEKMLWKDYNKLSKEVKELEKKGRLRNDYD